MMLDTDTSPAVRHPAVIGFPVVTKIVEAITAQPQRDRVGVNVCAEYVVKSMAEENGFAAFQTPEERELASTLRELAVGPRAAYYGWRLYRRYRQGGDITLDAVSY